MENLNQPDTLEKLKTKVFEHMKNWTPVRKPPRRHPRAAATWRRRTLPSLAFPPQLRP